MTVNTKTESSLPIAYVLVIPPVGRLPGLLTRPDRHQSIRVYATAQRSFLSGIHQLSLTPSRDVFQRCPAISYTSKS
jgi:hypothetical protein